MNWYKDKKSEWTELISDISNNIGKDNIMIEKDVIQSLFLKELSKQKLPFVFKGGTSLSKCYGIIDRFSEDIDLSMTDKLTEAQRKSTKKIILEITESLGLTLKNPEDIHSGYSYNKYVFLYNSLFHDEDMEIIIETSYYLTSYPVEYHKVHSFIGNYCKEQHIKLPEEFALDDIYIQVQTLERTFIDKVFAICDYKIQNKQDRDSRHLYDIYKLLKYVSLADNLSDLIAQVRADRLTNRSNYSADPKYDIPSMLQGIIDTHFYENDYKKLTSKLLYEDVSYEQAVEDGIQRVANSDIFKLRNNEHIIDSIDYDDI